MVQPKDNRINYPNECTLCGRPTNGEKVCLECAEKVEGDQKCEKK